MPRELIAKHAATTPIRMTEVLEIVPDMVTLVGNWSRKGEIHPTTSEQDLSTRLYTQLFEPFFEGLGHTA